MKVFDVFNGDADGICSLQQLRLAEPVDSELVTGVKRDIQLLDRVSAAQGDQITVLDVSLDKNRDGLLKLLAAGAKVRYFDHHFAGDIPEHAALSVHIDTAPDIGTSLLVDQYLQGAQRAWAVVGTFGDNMDESAMRAAATLDVSAAQLEQLKQLGIYINYNGYGSSVSDLHFAPDALYRELSPYQDPLDFIGDSDSFQRLADGYHEDMRKAENINSDLNENSHAIYIFPAEAWARRVSGVYANHLAQSAPDRAHALLTRKADGGFLVSVRAPLNRKDGADELCRQFDTGGGRKAAAGINHLPEEEYARFAERFGVQYG